MNAPQQAPSLTKNVTRVSRLDLPGAGQVYVDGKYAYVGHITNKEGLATSILDVSDPRNPKVVCQLPVGDKNSHSHKARVIGDVMIVNMEQNMTAIGRKADELPKLRKVLREALGRDPNHKELADKLGVSESEIPAVEAMEKTPYDQGGFKIYDIKDRANPKLLTHHRTHGRGVHRFDMDANYAYISTEMPGYIGNILVIYDIRNPAKPEEVSRWWLPGQHLAGGEKPAWPGRQHRLHHTVRVGDRLYAGCWHGGVRVIDVADIRSPKTVGAYNYHPPFPEPSHTFMGLPKRVDGRQIAVAIDEEDHAHSAEGMAKRRGRPHGPVSLFQESQGAWRSRDCERPSSCCTGSWASAGSSSAAGSSPATSPASRGCCRPPATVCCSPESARPRGWPTAPPSSGSFSTWRRPARPST